MSTVPGGADVRSVQVLVDLDAAFQRFVPKGTEALAAMRVRFDRGRRLLAQRAEDANYQVRRLASALEDASDEDADDCERALDRARSMRDEIHSWQRRVEEEHQAFRRAAARFEAVLDRTVAEGRTVLREKIDLLNEYLAVDVELPDAASATRVAAGAPSTSQASSNSLRTFPLPPGFVWVPLASINLQDELKDVQAAADFQKMDMETMRQGLVTLRSEILPGLSASGVQRDREYFREIDRAKGATGISGLQHIYDSFFGESHIYLSRGRSPGQFDITNGRHRIQLARELGWDAVPAKTDGTVY